MNNAAAEITSAAVLFVERCSRKRRRAVDSRDDPCSHPQGWRYGGGMTLIHRFAVPLPPGKGIGDSKRKSRLAAALSYLV